MALHTNLTFRPNMTFQPKCTLPPPGTAFVYAPPIRGTSNILWNCLSILVLCTWSILHLNVPLQARPTSRRQSFTRWLYRTANKITWALNAVFAPEITLGHSVGDLVAVYDNCKDAREWALADGVEWSLRHSFFANMGGFVLEFDELGSESTDTGQKASESQPQRHSQNDTETISLKAQLIPRGEAHETSLVQQQTSPFLRSTHSQRKTLSWNEHGPRPDSAGIESPVAVLRDNEASSVQTKVTNETRIPEDLVSVHRYFSQYSIDSKIGLDALAQHTYTMDQHIGESSWHVDPRNRHLVIAAMENITPKQVRSARGPWAWYIGAAALQGSSWILDANQLLFARERGIISQLPNTTEDELKALSNGDVLVKALAVTQVVWLFLQLSIRAAHRQPIPQLEILVLAIASCAFFTYITMWKKPQDVKTVQTIKANRYPTPDEIIVLAARGPICWGMPRRTQSIPNNHPSSHYRGSRNMGIQYRIASGVLGSMLFGGLHCLAWNSVFPTNTERILWRVSCVITMTLPATFYIIVFFAKMMGQQSRRSTWKFGLTPTKIIGISFFFFFWPIYLPARLYVLVESIRSLLYLPPEAFLSTWVANAPQLN